MSYRVLFETIENGENIRTTSVCGISPLLPSINNRFIVVSPDPIDPKASGRLVRTSQVSKIDELPQGDDDSRQMLIHTQHSVYRVTILEIL